jgi:hypothetical protein
MLTVLNCSEFIRRDATTRMLARFPGPEGPGLIQTGRYATTVPLLNPLCAKPGWREDVPSGYSDP